MAQIKYKVQLKNTKSHLNLRKTANGKIIGSIPHGTVLTADGSKSTSTWKYVTYKGTKGYVSSSYLKKVGGSSTSSGSNKSAWIKGACKGYNEKSLKTVKFTFKKGQKITVLKTISSTVLYIQYNGKKGYIKKSNVSYSKVKSSSSKKSSSSGKKKGSSVADSKGSDNALAKTLKKTNTIGIYGMPYQFMPHVDHRLSADVRIGRCYAENIFTDMPLLLLTPGKPSFLSKFKKKDKQNALKLIKKSGSKSIKKGLNDLIGLTDSTEDARYYTFSFDYANYYNYVNPALWNCAIYLGIGNQEIQIGTQTKKLCKFDWSKASYGFNGYFGCNKYVAFYLDSEDSITETFSNDVTESSIGSGVNSISDTAREINFLTGSLFNKTLLTDANKDAYNAASKKIDNIATKYLKGSKMFKSLSKGALTVASGGKLLFPKIWGDSSLTRSYDVSLKLRSPDCDTLSWYLNICVPMIHLLCLAAPRQLSGNGYTSPFLVRATYKGLFNIDTGMIDTMTFSKGKEGSWTSEGLPTEVDVSISLKDLYDVMFISGIKSANKNLLSDLIATDSPKYILKNTGMMDYLANMCGVNVNEPELKRTLAMYANLVNNVQLSLTQKTARWASQVQNDVTDVIYSNYKNTFGW